MSYSDTIRTHNNKQTKQPEIIDEAADISGVECECQFNPFEMNARIWEITSCLRVSTAMTRQFHWEKKAFISMLADWIYYTWKNISSIVITILLDKYYRQNRTFTGIISILCYSNHTNHTHYNNNNDNDNKKFITHHYIRITISIDSVLGCAFAIEIPAQLGRAQINGMVELSLTMSGTRNRHREIRKPNKRHQDHLTNSFIPIAIYICWAGIYRIMFKHMSVHIECVSVLLALTDCCN